MTMIECLQRNRIFIFSLRDFRDKQRMELESDAIILEKGVHENASLPLLLLQNAQIYWLAYYDVYTTPLDYKPRYASKSVFRW